MSRARLLLVGGGHAHLEVLRRLQAADLPVETTLISAYPRHHYSGMAPGYLAGLYEESELSFDLSELSRRAGARFVRDRVEQFNPRARRIVTRSGGEFRYDWVSFNIGSQAAGSQLPEVRQHAQMVKPMSRVVELKERFSALLKSGGGPRAVSVVGGGAAGVEVALALDRLGRDRGSPCHITLWESDASLLHSAPQTLRRRAQALLSERGIDIQCGARVESVQADSIQVSRRRPTGSGKGQASSGQAHSGKGQASSGQAHSRRGQASSGAQAPDQGKGHVSSQERRRVPSRGEAPPPEETKGQASSGGRAHSDLAVWLTGAAAQPLLRESGLPVDERGFLLVDEHLRSISDSRVFGAGDCVTPQDHPTTPKAGVYAVREAPVLWENLASVIGGGPPTAAYRPQHGFLSILNTCDGRALLDYHGWVSHSRWAWWLKDWIDRRFVRRYQFDRPPHGAPKP